MADTEVENILREIRERVYAEQEAAARSSRDHGDATSPEQSGLEPIDSLPRLESYLDTTARAWDRLPPLVSNRSGTPARIELWLKRHFKRATRWYAWEQINFNAAVHHALNDLVQLLSASQQTIQSLRSENENRQSEVRALRTQLDSQQRLIAEQRQTIEAESAAISTAVEAHAVVVDERLAAVVNELRETVAALKEEERVCFKQLALETSEAAVLEDRARRKTAALLEQLERRIKELETGKS
jgi:hypothetical protein